MVSDLAEGVGRILPFVQKVQEQTLNDDIDLLEDVIRRLYDIFKDTAEFIGSYVHQSALSRSITVRNESKSDD
jgi:hypothetical protein